jgi:hypothetical protein
MCGACGYADPIVASIPLIEIPLIESPSGGSDAASLALRGRLSATIPVLTARTV